MNIKAKENNLTDSIKQKETNIFGVISRIHNPNAIFIKNINNDGTITAEYLDGEVTTFNNKNLDPYYEEVVDSETNKRFRKLKPQIVSELTQKPVEQLTDDDFNNVANYFQQQTVSELVRGNNKNGVLDKSIFESNLNLDENNELNIPLNINGQNITLPINSASQSNKNINRYKELLQKDPNTLSESELTEKKAIEDIAINDAITARQQYNINEKYNALDVSKLNLTMENRDIKITPTLAKSMTTGEYWATFAGKSFKEGLAAVSTGILGLFDYYENEQEREAHKADIVGYVPQSYRVAEQQAMEKAMAAMERGDILEAAWHAKFQVLPEIAQEVGELLVTAIAMGAVTAATGGLGGAAAAVVTGAKLSKAISKASKIGLTLSKYLVAPVATSADQYLTGVATYEANNNNEPMSLARRSTYMLGLAMTNAVDLALIKQAGKIALGTAHKAVDSITDPVKKKMAKGALARYATATLGGGAGEGLQEYVQQIFDTSMTQNQADGKTLIEIALDPETQFSALMGAMVGGTVGAGANAVGDTLGKTFQGIEAGAKAIGSGISSVSSSIANNKAGVNNSKNVVQGLSSIEKSISLANDSDTIAQAETLVSNFKANVDNSNYDINENDIHRINTLEAKLALKKEAVQSGSMAAYTKDSSAFIKDFIMDFSDTVSDFATATDPTTLQQQSEFLWANRGKIKALKNYIAQGRITVDKETKNVLDSAEQTFNEISGGVIDSAEPDNDFIEELLNDKEDRFFYMYENANEEQKQKLAEIASQDQDLKHLVEKDKNGKISIKKSLADVRIETTKGKHGTKTYSEAINFYNKKLIRLERKAKKEDLTPKEERQKVYYEGKISSYKNTVIHFLDTQVEKLKEFADIYKNPTEEDIIDPETDKTIGVIIGRYEGVDPQGNPSSFEVNKGDDEKAPSKSGSGKVIAETIDNLKRMNRLLKKRYIPTETKNNVKQSLQDANEAIDTINGILSKNGVAESDLHEYIQIGNRRTQNTSPEATESSTINDNKKQVENTTKEEKTIVEAKKDTTEESTKKEEIKETKTEPKQEVVSEKKEETNVIDIQDNKVEQEETKQEPEPIEEENKPESVEEEITPEPVEEEPESDIVEEETQQVNTEDENTETDSTSSNKEKLDTLLRNIRGRVNRLIELGAIFSDDDYQFLEEFNNDFSRISEYKRYVKRHGVEFVKANYMHLIKEVFDKYDSSPYEELDDDYIDDLDESTINNYFEFLENLMFEIRDEIISKSRNEFEKLYKDKTPSEYWDKIFTNPTIDDLKELQSFIENLVASENRYLDGRMSKEADERFHIIKNEINDYLEDLDNEDTDTISEEVEENTLSEATESSVNEDSEEEVDNTTEEESLVTEPENSIYVEENEEVIQEPSTTEDTKDNSDIENYDDITENDSNVDEQINNHYEKIKSKENEIPEEQKDEFNRLIEKFEKADNNNFRKKILISLYKLLRTVGLFSYNDDVLDYGKLLHLTTAENFKDMQEEERKAIVKKYQDQNKYVIDEKSPLHFSKPQKVVIEFNGKNITFNSINHAIATLITGEFNEDVYKSGVFNENRQTHYLHEAINLDLTKYEDKLTGIILDAIQDLFFRNRDFRNALIKAKNSNTQYTNEIIPQIYEKYENIKYKNEQIKDAIKDKDFSSVHTFREELENLRKELKDLEEKNNKDLTSTISTLFLDLYEDIEDIYNTYKEGKAIIFTNQLAGDQIIIPNKDGYIKLNTSNFSGRIKTITDILFFNKETVEGKIDKWQEFINEEYFIMQNLEKNKSLTLTFQKRGTKVIDFTIQLKINEKGEYEYKLNLYKKNKIEYTIPFNSHPILATITKNNSLKTKEKIEKDYMNEKDKEYGVTELRKEVESTKKVIKDIKSLYFLTKQFKNNFSSIANGTLANAVEVIERSLREKIKKLTEDNETLKDRLKNEGIDLDGLLLDLDVLRNSKENFNRNIIFKQIYDFTEQLGEVIDKLLIKNKTTESKIRSTYRAKNYEKYKAKENTVWNSIKEFIKNKYSNEKGDNGNLLYAKVFLIDEYKKLFEEKPEEFISTLLKRIEDLENSIKQVTTKIQLINTKSNIKVTSGSSSEKILEDKLDNQAELAILKKIKNTSRIPQNITYNSEKKTVVKYNKEDKSYNEVGDDYFDDIYLVASDIIEDLDNLFIKELLPESIDEDTGEILLFKEQGNFIPVFTEGEPSTVIPYTTNEEDTKLKDKLVKLFFTPDKTSGENAKKRAESINNNNAAYFLLNNVKNFASAVDFAVSELFYTNTKIFNDPTVYMGAVINDLGKSVLKALGLRLNQSIVSYVLEKQILQDIGYLALNYAENMGYLETSSIIINNRMTDVVINKTNEYDRDVLNYKYELMSKKEERKSGTYSFEKEKLPKRRERNPESASLQDANKKLMATPFRVNYEAIDLIEQNRYSVQRALGWLTEEEIQDLPTKDLKDSHKGINLQIEKSIDELIALKKEAELNRANKPEYIYFNTFSASNTRMHIDSSTINPQNDKLHRFLFSPVSEEEDLQKEVVLDSDDSQQQFTYAIGQGLGLPVDKNTNEARSEWFKKIKTHLVGNKKNIENLKTALLSNNKAEIEKIGKEIELPIEVEEFSHFLQALLVLEDTEILINDNVIVGRKGVQFLTVEHDSATSGFVIRALASGVFAIDDNNVKEINKAVGIYTDSNDNINSRNQFFDKDSEGNKNVDVYESAAIGFSKEENTDAETLIENAAESSYRGVQRDYDQHYVSALPFVTLIEGNTYKNKKGQIIATYEFGEDKRFAIYNSIKNILPFSVKKVVAKKLRKFMKSLVMPFGYQIGFSGALETATEESINDLMLKIANPTNKEEKKARDAFLDQIIGYFSGIKGNIYGVDVEELLSKLGVKDNTGTHGKDNHELFLELIKHVNYENIMFKVPVAFATTSPIKSTILGNKIESKYHGVEMREISLFELIQHTVMYVYAGTLYENMRTKFGMIRGSAVFNSLVNAFSAQAITNNLGNDKKLFVETTDEGSIKSMQLFKDGEESTLAHMPIRQAKKILQGKRIIKNEDKGIREDKSIKGLPIHSSDDINLNTIEVEFLNTPNSEEAYSGVKTEMPINFKENNFTHSKIALKNNTYHTNYVTKTLSIPTYISIKGSAPTLAAVTIHNLDAEIMAHAVNKNVGQVLPVFDAIVSSPFAVNDSSTALNKSIYEISMETSIEDRSLKALKNIDSSFLFDSFININRAEAKLIWNYLKGLGVDSESIGSLLKVKTNTTMKGEKYPTMQVEVSLENYKSMLLEVSSKVKELKEKNKNTITVANVDGIDGTAYSKTKTEAPNQNPKTNDDVYNYFYSQGTEDDKNDFEDVMFSDNDAEARLNLFDTLVGDSHVDTTGWFSQVKELLQSLGSLRLNSLGVSLVEGLGIYGEYNKSNHTVYLERSTVANTLDRYRHPAIRYAHELIHAIMATALDQANKLGITKEVGQLFDLYNIASKHLTPEDFLPEYYNNYEEAIQEAKATYDYIFSNSLENNKRLRGLNEFIAYALTDERLARKLQSILIQQKSDKKQSLWSRLKEIVRTIFNIAKPEENKDLDGLMANLVDLFKENKDLNAFEALQNLVQKIVDADNKAMQQAEEQNQFSGIKKLIYTAGEKAIIPANKTIGGFIQNLITLTDNITNYDKLMSTLQNETGEYNLRTRLIATSKILLNVLTSSKARKKLPQVLNYIGLTTFASYNFVGRWIDEMKEADEYKRTIEDKARASRKIDQNAQGIKNITISQLTELFKDENRPNGLSEEEKAMLTDIVLKLDLSCLKKRENGKDIPITADDLKNLMTDNEKIDETISSLRKELLDITQDETLHYDSKTRTLLLNKITMLADYLATGNVYITGATNARSVRQSVESDQNVSSRNKKAREIENLIDQLASLMALKQIPLSNRQQVASMSTDGLDAFINIHRTNKENDYDYYVQISGTSEKNIPFAKAYDNLSKGFTKVISNNSYDVVIGYANQAEFYNQKGFKPIPDVIAGEIGGEKLLYYKNGFNSKASRNGAAYVYTGFDKIGKSMMLIAEEELQFKETGLNFAGMSNADKIRRLADEYTARVGKQAKALTAPLSDKELTIEELRNLNKNYKNVYPVYNQHGGVQDYNIIPPKEIKKQLSITDDAFRILGEMVATNLRREQGSELNKELLDFIFKESDIFSSLNARPDANAISHDNDNNRWIPITPDSFDPFARQMWEELDSNLRQYILTYMKATNKPLYIREDALLDVFGQKDIAVSNVITRNLPVFRQAIQVLGMIAKFVATEYKGLVVIKTPQVLIGNVLSNVALALVQGINPVDIIKSYVSDFRAIQDYEKTDKRLKELQFKVNITNDTKKKLEINREIEILKSKLQNNSVHELMNLGYKQTIVEDISNTDFDNSSYFDSKIERARKTLPRPLLAGFDILFMTKRTAGYQFMHKMTGYSDLLARSVEYKHKKKQIEKKYKIGTEEYEEAMHKLHGQLADNYINYDKPQSAVEQWLNDMGLVLFTKFFKRIQSVIVNHVIDNPLGVAAFLTANTVVDVPNIFETSIAVRDLTAYTHNPVDFIGELITPPLLNLLSNDNKMQDV